MRRAVQRGELPPPLENSQKCDRCSMAGICLPDEVNLLREMNAEKGPDQEESQEEDQGMNQRGNLEERIRMLLASWTIRFRLALRYFLWLTRGFYDFPVLGYALCAYSVNFVSLWWNVARHWL